MTNAEYFNQVECRQDKTHIHAFEMMIAELEKKYPKDDFGYWMDKYKSTIEWLNSEKPEVSK